MPDAAAYSASNEFCVVEPNDLPVSTVRYRHTLTYCSTPFRLATIDGRTARERAVDSSTCTPLHLAYSDIPTLVVRPGCSRQLDCWWRGLSRNASPPR
jgi:hypothetical protein